MLYNYLYNCQKIHFKDKLYGLASKKSLSFKTHFYFIFRYFLLKGAIVDQRGGTLNGTPLHWAIRFVFICFSYKKDMKTSKI